MFGDADSTVLSVLTAAGPARRVGVPARYLEEGYWWQGQTEHAYTMQGTKRLLNLAQLLVELDQRGLPGAVIEAGVWRGGGLVWMGLHTPRVVYGADSFEGCPPPSWVEDLGDRHHELDFLKVSEEQVREILSYFPGLLTRVRLVKGWFRDTLPGLPGPFALVRIDADLFESTYQALQYLYPKLVPGGYCIVDDYGAVEPARRATDVYRARLGIHAPIHMTDHTEAVWMKTE